MPLRGARTHTAMAIWKKDMSVVSAMLMTVMKNHVNFAGSKTIVKGPISGGCRKHRIDPEIVLSQ
jgi:hypothetical protein